MESEMTEKANFRKKYVTLLKKIFGSPEIGTSKNLNCCTLIDIDQGINLPSIQHFKNYL